MSDRSREFVLAGLVAATVVAGLLVDAFVGPVVATDPGRVATEERFIEKATFCPPAIRQGEGSARVVVTSTSQGPVPVAIEPVVPEEIDLPPDRILTYSSDAGGPLNVVGFGAPAIAGSMQTVESPIEGIGAGRCATEASRTWYFAEGSSALDHDQRLIVFNPFPFEAVVRVSFVTPGGVESRAALSDLAVPSGTSVGIRVNDYILRRRVLSTIVTAVRGRVLAWRLLLQRTEDRPRGLQFSLGAPAPAQTWYFPEGGTGRGFEQRISIMNPSDEEATVTVSLAHGDEAVQPEDLAEIAIPARTAHAVLLPGENQAGTSTIVQSVNGVGVVAERTTWYSQNDLEGVSSEIGATGSATSWMVPPAAKEFDLDSVVVLNTSGTDVDVSVRLLRADGGPLRPRLLRSVSIPAGLRLNIELERWTGGEPMFAMVDADGEIVVERRVYSEAVVDTSSVMGTPLE